MLFIVPILFMVLDCYRIVIDNKQESNFINNEKNPRFIDLVYIQSSKQIVVKYVYDTNKFRLQCLKYDSNTKMYIKQHNNYLAETSVYTMAGQSTFKKVSADTMVLTQGLTTGNYLEYVFKIDSSGNLKNLTKMPNNVQQSLLYSETQTLANNYFNIYSGVPSPIIRQYDSSGNYLQQKTFIDPKNKVSPQILTINDKKYILYLYTHNGQNQFIVQDFVANINSLNSQQTVIKTFNDQVELVKLRARQVNEKYLVVVWIEKSAGPLYKINLQLFSVANGMIQAQRTLNIVQNQNKQPNLLEMETYESANNTFMILNYGNETVYSYSADINSFAKSTIDHNIKQVTNLQCNNNNADEVGQLVVNKEKGQLDFIFYCQHQQKGSVDLVKVSYTDKQIDDSEEKKWYTQYIVFIVLGVLFVLAIVFVMIYLKKKIKERKMTEMIKARKQSQRQTQKKEITKIRVSNDKKTSAKLSQIHNNNELNSLNDDKRGLIGGNLDK